MALSRPFRIPCTFLQIYFILKIITVDPVTDRASIIKESEVLKSVKYLLFDRALFKSQVRFVCQRLFRTSVLAHWSGQGERTNMTFDFLLEIREMISIEKKVINIQ